MTDKSEIVNKFNAYFTNIGSNLANNIKYKGIRGHTYYLIRIVESNFTFKYVEEDVIKRTIINLSNKSSYGYDGLSTKLLKILEPALTKSLALLTNQVLTTGIFPDKLKIAKVIPIYKKGEQTVFSIYHSVYKIGGLCLNMKYIVMIQETTIKYTLIKLNMLFAQKCLRHSLPLLLNNLPEIVNEKRISHSTQGFVKYVKLYFLQSYQVACTVQDCYVCNIKNHKSPINFMLYVYLLISLLTYIYIYLFTVLQYNILSHR